MMKKVNRFALVLLDSGFLLTLLIRLPESASFERTSMEHLVELGDLLPLCPWC